MHSPSVGVWRYGFRIVVIPGQGGNRLLMILRRACEFQLYALFFALPFEYYFRSREQTLFTSLKLQILSFAASWVCLKSATAVKSDAEIRCRLRLSMPGRLLAAVALFVLMQSLGAAFASEFGANAAKAAVKTGLGAFLAIVAADLVAGFQPRPPERSDPVRASMLALSTSGALAAVLGLGELAGIDTLGSVVHLFQKSRYLVGDRIRLLSTMEHPNTAGALLSASLFASLALAASQNRAGRRQWKVAWLGLAAVQGLALVLTLSRGAIASTMLAILVASLIFRHCVGETQRRTVMSACAVALVMGMSGFYFARRGTENSGLTSRKHIATWGLKAAEEVRYLLPAHTYQERIAVQNTSPLPWQAGECGVGYKWHSLSTAHTEPVVAGTAFAETVVPGRRVEMPVSLTTPSGAGEYFLIWFVVRDDGQVTELKESFSPGVLCLVSPSGSGFPGVISDRARGYLAAIRDERRQLGRTAAPDRSDLWRAALKMVSQNPFLGKGPDSFRLLKSKYMDFPAWDETVLANNLYLEILSGNGILGLASFLWLLWEFGRVLAARVVLAGGPLKRSSAYFGAMYLSAFTLHGLVDYFLKFTPTFLLFWLLLGTLCAVGGDNRGTHANRI